jgi:hypothetical protein
VFHPIIQSSQNSPSQEIQSHNHTTISKTLLPQSDLKGQVLGWDGADVFGSTYKSQHRNVGTVTSTCHFVYSNLPEQIAQTCVLADDGYSCPSPCDVTAPHSTPSASVYHTANSRKNKNLSSVILSTIMLSVSCNRMVLAIGKV